MDVGRGHDTDGNFAHLVYPVHRVQSLEILWGEHMTDFFLGIAFGVLLVAVPSFILGILTARRKDKK
jgi:hypothetical protein